MTQTLNAQAITPQPIRTWIEWSDPNGIPYKGLIEVAFGTPVDEEVGGDHFAISLSGEVLVVENAQGEAIWTKPA